ncbi:hypothetical protein WA158_002493 [Blastocystis sp. Blastoise]
MFSFQLFIVFATVTIDCFGTSLMMAVIPFFSEKVGGTGFEMGMFYTAYSVTQMISIFFMGPLSDKYGRRFFLLLSLFGSFTGPLFQSFAPSMLVMNILRAYTGILAGSMTIGQASIADMFPLEKRGSYFSFLLGITASAYILGPVIGGVLGEISLQMPFWISSICAFIVFIIAIFCLKETNATVIKKTELKTKKHTLLKKTGLTIEENKQVDEIRMELTKLNSKKTKEEKKSMKNDWNIHMIFWLVIRCINECICIILSSYYGLYIISKLNATSMHYSLTLCGTGIATVIVQLIFFPLFREKLHFSVVYIAIVGAIIMLGATILATLAPSPWYAVLGGSCIFVGYAFINPIPITVLSIQAPPECQGEVLSVGIYIHHFSIINWFSFIATIVSQAAYIIIPLLYGSFYDFSPFWTISSTIAFAGIVVILLLIFLCVPGSLTCADKKEISNIQEEKLPSKSEKTKESKDSTSDCNSLSVNTNNDSIMISTQSNSLSISSISDTSIPLPEQVIVNISL